LNSVLRRKAGANRAPAEFGEMTPAKAIRLSLSKAGQDILRVAVSAGTVEEQRLTLDKMSEAMPEGAMILLMHGPKDCRGLVGLDVTAMTAVVEALTTGRVTKNEAADRKPTATDALICLPFLSSTMAGFGERLKDETAGSWATGFVPDEAIGDLRRLPLLLEDEEYRMQTIPVDFNAGAKSGKMVVVMPWRGRYSKFREEIEEDSDELWEDALYQAVLPAKAELEAVLYRKKMTLTDVAQFTPGTLIKIPLRSIGEVSLENLDGEKVATVRLGQSQGFRAVRITHPDLPDEDSLGDEMELPNVGAADVGGLAMMPQNDGGGDFGGDGATIDMSSIDSPDMDMPMADMGMPDIPMGDLPMDDDGAMPQIDIGAIDSLDDTGDSDFPQIDISMSDDDDLDDLPLTMD
ncbi:MAG: FliM/FliN family flagellar motor switch protein, partial [Mangrovicoccus sp.]